MFKIINNLNELKELKNELDLIYSSNKSVLFLSPEYVINTFEIFLNKDSKNKLYFIIKYYKNIPTNYIPLYINKNGTLKFIFDRHTDFCSIVGDKINYQKLKELSKIFINNKDIKRINFENLHSNDVFLNYFKHFFKLNSTVFSYNNHTFINPINFIFDVENFNSKEKSELKRIVSKNIQFPFKIFKNDDTFPIKEIISIRDEMIKNKKRNRNFFTADFIKLIEILYKNNEIEIFTKIENEKLISVSIVLINNLNQRMVWISLFRNYQFIHLSSYIEYVYYLKSINIEMLNFGRGSYNYKTKNFKPIIENLYNFRYSKSKFDLFFLYYHPLKEMIKSLIRK